MSRTTTPTRPRTNSTTTTRRASNYRRTPAPKRRPVPTPVRSRPTPKTRARRRTATPFWVHKLSNACLHVAAVAFVTFIVSAIMGNALLESARRNRIQLQERANRATSEISLIRRSVDESTNLKEIEKFAASRGLVRSGRQYAPTSVVAKTGGKVIVASSTKETIFANAR